MRGIVLVALVFVWVSVSGGEAAEKAGWQTEWEKTVAAAEKEGELSIYGQGRAGVGKSIQAFTQAYPKIKLHFIEGSGSNLAKKIMAEKRAGKHLVDLSVGGGGTMVMVYYKANLLQPIAPLMILPEVRDQTKWWSKKHLYADPEEKHVFMAQGDSGSGIGAINTNLIKPGEIQSWWDLLLPKLKGKIVMTDPNSAGNIGSWRFLYYSPDLGPPFIKRLLTETSLTFATDEHQMMDWVGSGKFYIHAMAKFENTQNARKQGLPVLQVFSEKEGDAISTGSGHLCVFKETPHPNAAKVFVNWFLSREGQLAWQKFTGRNSFRTDIPKDMLPYKDEQVPKEGRNYLLSSLPKYEDVGPLRKLVQETLAQVKQ
ncbi:MAG TPA: extracellular solute-binding protein [Candidatus Acidoferrales bacterium]|nr:extracellular solute-binding protein [Candidatus Acidoferrales bacterium]